MKKAQTDASALLEKNKNIKEFYGCNNTSTIGIAKMLVKEKRIDIVMVGFDMAKETQQFIQDAEYQGVSSGFCGRRCEDDSGDGRQRSGQDSEKLG